MGKHCGSVLPHVPCVQYVCAKIEGEYQQLHSEEMITT